MVEIAVNNAEKLGPLIAPVVEAMGFDLVRIAFTGTGRQTLQVMAERPDGSMNVDDCAAISRELSAVLDIENPIRGEFSLEVSSPGLDRPLTRPRDFERFAGYDAKVECRTAVDGQRCFKGRLLGLHGGNVRIKTDSGAVALPLSEVMKAKLLMSAALVEAGAKPERAGKEGSDDAA